MMPPTQPGDKVGEVQLVALARSRGLQAVDVSFIRSHIGDVVGV